MDAEERHWTEDSELIERFVLNRLEPGERNELEDHLRICEVCKQAVRAEQLLIAGIRRSGRERFKAELAAKLSAAGESNVPWPHILSAAAVVVIVMSIAFYNRWFEVITPPEIERSVESPHVAERKTKESEQPLKKRIPEEPPAVGKQHHPKQPQPKQRDEKITRSNETAVVRNVSPAQGARAVLPPTMEASQRMASALTADDELWLEGTVVESTVDMLNAPAGGEEQTRLFKTERQDGERRLSEPQRPVFRLEQEPLAALPIQHRNAQQQAATVAARLHLRGDTTDVTLYLDPLLQTDDLHQARIEMSADSLIVSLADRRIIYRLPEGWREKLRPMR